MNIEIKQTLESIRRKNKVNWKLRWRRYLLSIQILFFCALILIIMCVQQLVFFYSEFEKSSRFNQNSIYVLLTISILLLFFNGSQYLKYRSQKKIFFANVDLLKSSIININNDFLTFKTDNSETTVKWNAIKRFYFIEDCLFLSQFDIKDSYEYLIDLKPIEVNEKKQLLNFVMKNIGN